MSRSDMDLRREWNQLSTPDLEELLQAELEKQTPDDDAVLLLLHILESREPDGPLYLTPREEAAFARYKQNAVRRGKRPISALRGLSVAACCVMILGFLFAVVPQQVEADSFWEMLQRWSNTVLGYLGREDKFGELKYSFETENPGLQQVYDAVLKLGVTDPVVPMWLPDGCELTMASEKDTPMLKGIWARFSYGESGIIYRLDVYKGEPAHQFYRDDSYYEEYEKNGMNFYVTQNNDSWVAVWTKDNIECSISIACQEETLRRVLRSIFVMEDT